MRRATVLTALLLSGLLLVALAAPATAAEVSLASDGTVLVLTGGRFGELFPESGLAPADASVLALDVLRNDGARDRHLVPGSEDFSAESSARLVYEPSGQAAYLLWQGLVGGIHPVLFFTSFDGTAWSEVIEIVSGAFATKGTPDLVVTREDDGAGVTRTVVHLTWWQEQGGQDVSRKLYAQVILENGVYLGWTPVVDLATLVPEAPAPTEVGADVADALRVQPGRDDHSVVVGFVDPDARRLRIVEASVLSPALTELAEKARGYIIEIGVQAKDRAELASWVSAYLHENGAAFHVATLEHFVGQVTGYLVGCGLPLTPTGVGEMAEKARGYIIEIGAKIGQAGLSAENAATFLAVGATAEDDALRHLTRVTLVSERAVPDVGGPARLYLSQSGRHALVAWDDAERVYYRESTNAGWNWTSFVEVAPGLSREAIHAMLAERVRPR